jgi:hypothetical protein
MAASRELFGRFSGIVLAAGRRIDNPPQVSNLPHRAAGRKTEPVQVRTSEGRPTLFAQAAPKIG